MGRGLRDEVGLRMGVGLGFRWGRDKSQRGGSISMWGWIW